MTYGDKVRIARERLKMNRMQFAVFLESSEGYIRNIEVAKDKEIRFSREREEKIISAASLPPGFFASGVVDIEEIDNDNNELFYRLFPDAKDKIDYNEATEFISKLAKFRDPK